VSQGKRKWVNILINPRYQLKYVLWLSATGLTLVVFYSAIIYRYISENYKILVDLSPMDDATKAQMYSELKHLILVLGGSSIGFLALASVLGLVVSHRTAGPLYHFKRVFGEIKSGKLDTRVRLRPGDDFQDVAGSFNEMMDAIAAKGPRQG
jgi:methyl-accepting chemotaxis protein